MRIDPNKVKPIFLAAVEQGTPEQCEAYLDDACKGDADLRGRVSVLLRAHHGKDSLFDDGSSGGGPSLDPPIAEGPGFPRAAPSVCTMYRIRGGYSDSQQFDNVVARGHNGPGPTT